MDDDLKSEKNEPETPDLTDGTVFAGRTIRFPTPDAPIRPEDSESDPADAVSPNENEQTDSQTEESSAGDSTETDGRSFLSFFDRPPEKNAEEDRFRHNFRSFFETAGVQTDEAGEPLIIGESTDGEETDDDSEEEEEDGGDLTFDELVQREAADALNENLDALTRENDESALRSLGEKFDPENDAGLADPEAVEPDPITILEAMLFVGDRENRPLSLVKAAELMRNVSPAEAREAIDVLNHRYELADAPYRVVGEDDAWRLALQPEWEPIRERFLGKAKEIRLSQRAIDVLALVAYRQPISLAEIQAERSGSAPILTQLVKRNLIAVEKKSVEKKQVSYYRTTERFLKLLGIDSLDDLPIVDEIDYR